MKQSGVVLANGSNIINAGILDFKTWNHGAQGVLSFRANLLGGEAQLIMKGPDGSSLVVVNSSKMITGESCLIGPLYIPSGQYAINLTSSSAFGVYAGIYPTPRH